MAEVRAQLNNLRLAPRKVRALVDMVKRKDLGVALDQLQNMIRRPAHPLIKLLNSAAANGEHSYQMVRDNLYIKTMTVDEGVKLRRFMPKAYGRAGEIQKKTSCVEVVLAERVPGLKAASKKSAPTEVKPAEHVHEGARTGEKKPVRTGHPGGPEIKTEIKKGVEKQGFVKRFFQRKSI